MHFCSFFFSLFVCVVCALLFSYRFYDGSFACASCMLTVCIETTLLFFIPFCSNSIVLVLCVENVVHITVCSSCSFIYCISTVSSISGGMNGPRTAIIPLTIVLQDSATRESSIKKSLPDSQNLSNSLSNISSLYVHHHLISCCGTSVTVIHTITIYSTRSHSIIG
jgi:hypothetical protein